jgi:hypothetical protein
VDREVMKTFRFKPYLTGMGPTFLLELYDGGGHDSAGRWSVDYRLIQCGWTDTNTRRGTSMLRHKRAVIFDSVNGSQSPVYTHDAIDSRKAALTVLSFLSLRPGDTDSEYFADYTSEQLVFAQEHGESLSMYTCD